MKTFMFTHKKRENMLIPWEDKEKSLLSRMLQLDVKQHQWGLYRQIWKIQDCAERSSESIWNLGTEAQYMWGKNYFYFSNSSLWRKNSERRGALVCDFLPILQLQTAIIPVLYTHMNVCIFMFLTCSFYINNTFTSIKTLQTGSK